MYRHFNIKNSFTMEATFSGTVLDKYVRIQPNDRILLIIFITYSTTIPIHTFLFML